MLNVNKCKTVRKPGRYGDGRGGRGLSLNVHEAADGRITKSWTQRIRIDGRLTNVGLGRFPETTLAEARDLAIDNVRAAKSGNEVRQPRAAARTVPTFAECHESYIALHASEWSAGTHADWVRSFERYVFPTIGSKPVNRVTASDIVQVLQRIDKPSVHNKTRPRIGTVLDWAKAHGHVDQNVAHGIKAALPKIAKTNGHHDACDWRDAPAEYRRVIEAETNEARSLLFRFIALTGCRTDEARTARWADVGGDTWTFDQNKSKATYRFALSAAALEAVSEAKARGIKSEYIFASTTGSPVANSWASKQREIAGVAWKHHGWRSTISDWAIEHGFDKDLADKTLMHGEANAVRAAYQRTDRLEERRPLMEQWAKYLIG